jgi:hypothetical protein
MTREGDVDAATGTIGGIYSLRGLDNTSYNEDIGEEGRQTRIRTTTASAQI